MGAKGGDCVDAGAENEEDLAQDAGRVWGTQGESPGCVKEGPVPSENRQDED
jgi:hypothetical protein